MAWLLILFSLSAGQNPSPPSAEELLKKLDASPELKSRDKPFEVNASLGRLYLGQGRYGEAASLYEQALSKTEAFRALYVSLRSVTPAAAVAGCEAPPSHELAALVTKAAEKQRAKDLAGASSCVKAGAPLVIDAELQLGHAKFLAGNKAGALAVYAKTIETFENAAPDARYSRGALLLDWRGDDAASLKIAKSDFDAFLGEAQSSPKAREAKVFLARADAAIAAGGTSKLGAPAPLVRSPPTAPQAMNGQPPVLSKETMEAFQNAPRTPEMEKKFAGALDAAEAALAKGEAQSALDNYKQVMPYQPDNPRVRAGMAWSLFKLGKPMGDRVWSVATQDPGSVAALGDALKKMGNTAEAEAVWKRLAETVPSYAPKLQGR